MVYELEDNQGEHQGYFRKRENAIWRASRLGLMEPTIREYEQDSEFPFGSCEDDGIKQ
jgi:hypothetical protein